MSGGWKWLRAACYCGVLLASAPRPALADDDEEFDLFDDDKAKRAKKRTAAAEQAPAEAPAEAPADAPAADGPEAAPAAEAGPATPVGPSVRIRAYAGFGIGTRGFSRPTALGEQSLSSQVLPAAEVGLDVIAWPEDDFALAFQLRYQTLLWFVVTEKPPFALPNEVDARSERVELSITPSWKLGPVRLDVPLGATIRTFWPNVHALMTPGYSLIGPHARLMLAARIAGPISVRLGPELQWIMLIDDSLTSTGVNSQGVAIGGEAAVELALSDTWALGLTYRESHALVGSTRSVSFEDIERFLTARITGSF